MWLHVGTPAWTQQMEDTINHAVDVLTAHGAARRDSHDAVHAQRRGVARQRAQRRVPAVAASRPTQLTVVDIQHATDVLHPNRWDTVHYTARGADVLGGAVVPAIARLLPNEHAA